MKNNLNFDWVLINKLGVGSFPRSETHLKILKQKKIISILTLCDPLEGQLSTQFQEEFNCENFIIPDHRSKRLPTKNEIDLVINLLEKLILKGPVYVHCFAGVERSPLVCMAYLMKHNKISRQDALEYLMQIHPSTNPLKGQLDIL